MDTRIFSSRMLAVLVLVALLGFLARGVQADDFVVDPKIQNNGPIFRLATSDLPKAPLVILKGDKIDWENPGVRIEQLRLVAEKVGVRFGYGRYPWRRALKTVENGHADAAFVTGYTEERSQWGAFPLAKGNVDNTQAISQVDYWLYTLRDGPVRWDGDTLSGVTTPIGAGAGDLMTAKLKSEGMNIIEIDTYDQLARMVLADRLDAVISFRDLIDKVIALEPSKYEPIVKHPVPFRSADGHLMFSKMAYDEKRDTVEKIWDAIRELWQNGTMDQLFAKYRNLRKP